MKAFEFGRTVHEVAFVEFGKFNCLGVDVAVIFCRGTHLSGFTHELVGKHHLLTGTLLDGVKAHQICFFDGVQCPLDCFKVDAVAHHEKARVAFGLLTGGVTSGQKATKFLFNRADVFRSGHHARNVAAFGRINEAVKLLGGDGNACVGKGL